MIETALRLRTDSENETVSFTLLAQVYPHRAFKQYTFESNSLKEWENVKNHDTVCEMISYV